MDIDFYPEEIYFLEKYLNIRISPDNNSDEITTHVILSNDKAEYIVDNIVI